MKKITVISDTHGNIGALEKLLPVMKESDYVFHLGDYNKDIELYRKELGDKIYSVLGNCDGGGNDCVIEIDGVKILLTHGDRYGVKQSNYKLSLRAKELGVSVVFYGHTHVAEIETVDGVYLINPGCMTRYSQNMYCYTVIYDNKIVPKIVPLISY